MGKGERNLAQDFYSSWAQGTYLYVKWAAEHSVGYPELMVLYGLYTKGSLTQKAIGAFYGLPKQTVNAVIHNLQQTGRLTLEPGLRDRREKLVSLTQSGQAYANSVLAPLFEIEERVCGIIGQTRLTQMIETSNLFNTLFEKEMERKL